MTNPVIEAMARAICRAHRTGSGNMNEKDTKETENRAWDKHVVDARAALQALKENVSEEMLGDDTDICVGCCSPEPKDKQELFTLMIDTAMKEETDG